MNRIDTFLELVVRQNGSDLHMVAGNPPRVRLDGDTHTVKYRELTTSEMEQLLHEIMTEAEIEKFEKESNLDFATVVLISRDIL